MASVCLSWFELFQAANVGVIRQIEALKLDRADQHGYNGDGWSIHVNGAAAELAVAKVTGRFWNALARHPTTLPGDVGLLQVRWSALAKARLIVHDADPDEAVFVLVTGLPPTLEVVGSIRGADAKDPCYWTDPGTGRPAFFVPQAALEPVVAGPAPA